MEKGEEQADTIRRPATTDRKKAPKQQAQLNPGGRPWQQTKAALRFAPTLAFELYLLFMHKYSYFS
jgi:hypothetical protein